MRVKTMRRYAYTHYICIDIWYEFLCCCFFFFICSLSVFVLTQNLTMIKCFFAFGFHCPLPWSNIELERNALQYILHCASRQAPQLEPHIMSSYIDINGNAVSTANKHAFTSLIQLSNCIYTHTHTHTLIPRAPVCTGMRYDDTWTHWFFILI